MEHEAARIERGHVDAAFDLAESLVSYCFGVEARRKMTEATESAIGWVYVLSNPSMPGQLKIGFTDRTVPERVGELSSVTGVPAPFIWEYGVRVPQAQRIERAVHQELAGCRVNDGREFFSCEIVRAIESILSALELVKPHEVFDRQQKEQAAAAQHKQIHLAERWRDDCLARLQTIRQALEGEVGTPPFGGPFIGYALASYLVLEYSLGGKNSGGLIFLSVIAGAVLALVHQAKSEKNRKVAIEYQSRLESIEMSQAAVHKGFDNALRLIRQGKQFAEIEPSLVAAPSEQRARSADPRPPAPGQGQRESASKVSPPPAKQSPPPTEPIRQTVANRPSFFGCDRCGKTVDLHGSVSCLRFSCPAKLIKAEPRTRTAVPLELSGWNGGRSPSNAAAKEAHVAGTQTAATGERRGRGGRQGHE